MFLIYEFSLKIIFYFLILIEPIIKNEKAKKFIELRNPRRFKQNVLNCKSKHSSCYWLHVASAGEYEQAIPAIKTIFETTGVPFFVTYFSPSAQIFIKPQPWLAECSGLPLDSLSTFLWAIGELNCKGIFFVRYDFWPGLIRASSKSNINIFLLCAKNPLKSDEFLLPIKKEIYKVVFSNFTHIFAVSDSDLDYYKSLGLRAKLYLLGDPKWERAKERALNLAKKQSTEFMNIKCLIENLQVNAYGGTFVFGSPHKEEQGIIEQLSQLRHDSTPGRQKLLVILCPHEVTPQSVTLIRQKISAPCFVYSEIFDIEDKNNLIHISEIIRKSQQNISTIIVDKIGVLAELYALGDWCVVGGGFDGYLHNVLEPAAHGACTVFGNRLHRCTEAQVLCDSGAAMSFETPHALFQFLLSCSRVSGGSGSEHGARASATRSNARKLFSRVPATSDLLRRIFARGI